jgi:hypothetical protein
MKKSYNKKRYNVIALNQFMHDSSSFEEFINLKYRQGWKYLNSSPYGVVFEDMSFLLGEQIHEKEILTAKEEKKHENI